MRMCIKNGTIIDGTGAAPRLGSVIVTDEYISEMLSPAHVPAMADETIDAKGAAILPGLIDAHDHLTYHNTFGFLPWQWRLPRDTLIMRSCVAACDILRHGVTTIREMGAPGAVNLVIKEAIEKGELVGPRIVTCGTPLCISGGYAYEICTEVDGPDQVRATVRKLLKAGADFIKLMMSKEKPQPAGKEQSVLQFTMEEIRAAVDEAHQAGVFVTAHVCCSRGIERCLEAGVDSISHGVYINRELAEQMKQQGVYYTPTLGIYKADTDLFWMRGVAKARFCEVLTKTHNDNVRNIADVDLMWSVGSDAIVPMAAEMKAMVEAGLEPMRVICAATRVNAQLLGRGDAIGTLEVGKLADILIVDGNPLEDMMATANVMVVIKNGVVFWPNELLPMLPSMKQPSPEDNIR